MQAKWLFVKIIICEKTCTYCRKYVPLRAIKKTEHTHDTKDYTCKEL